MSRLAARIRCNYYPLPLREAERIRNLLQFPTEPFSALDPCVGEGIAFSTITRDSSARRYGIELDDQTLKALGVSPASALQAPWPLIRTFPPGSTLSRQDALTQHDTLAPVIGAEALPTQGAH